MKQYRYFVVYWASEPPDCGTGFCASDGIMLISTGELILNNTVVSVEKPILTEEDVRDVEECIATKLAGDSRILIIVRITSFQLLGEFEEGE